MRLESQVSTNNGVLHYDQCREVVETVLLALSLLPEEKSFISALDNIKWTIFSQLNANDTQMHWQPNAKP